MCGRYAFFNSSNFSDRFLVDENSLDFSADYNIAPGAMADIVTRSSPNSVKKAKWGLIPSWSNEFKMTFKTFNARVEGLEKSRLYEPLLKSNRCLVPANGFYEWTTKNGKAPHYIDLKDSKVFAFAGLYDVWMDVEGKEFYSYTIITTKARGLMKKIHHRMPVILKKEDEQTWVDNEMTDQKRALAMLSGYKSSRMREHEVGKEVNKASNNSPDLVKPVS